MIVEWRASPQRGDFDGSAGGEDALKVRGGRIVRGGCFHPEGGFGEEVAEDGDFESQLLVAQAGADDEFSSGGDAGDGQFQQALLLGGSEKLEDVEDADISRMFRQTGAEIVGVKRKSGSSERQCC